MMQDRQSHVLEYTDRKHTISRSLFNTTKGQTNETTKPQGKRARKHRYIAHYTKPPLLLLLTRYDPSEIVYSTNRCVPTIVDIPHSSRHVSMPVQTCRTDIEIQWYPCIVPNDWNYDCRMHFPSWQQPVPPLLLLLSSSSWQHLPQQLL